MFISQPFPSQPASSKVLKYTLSAGFIVFLILILFQPFGFSNTPSAYKCFYAVLFGLATFVITSFNAFLLPVLLPRFFEERHWTVGREIMMMLWHVVTVGLVNWLLMGLLYGEPVSLEKLIKTLGITAAVGIFPVSIMVLLKQQVLSKKYRSGAARLDSEVHMQQEQLPGDELILLQGDNLDESLRIMTSDLRYIMAADNYIRVHYMVEGKLVQKVMRGTLKKTEVSLKSTGKLFRCHRAYIVNLATVKQVTGNAQGYKLHLDGVNEPVPVSRSLHSELSELILAHRSSRSPR